MFLGEISNLKKADEGCNIMKLMITEKTHLQLHISLMGYAFLLLFLMSACDNVAAFITQNRSDKIHKIFFKQTNKTTLIDRHYIICLK